jgi:hypothetical protein
MSTSWPVRRIRLESPTLEELGKAIASGLASNFQDSVVVVEPCPDLQESPFHLAGEGLSGSPRVADVGGPPYLQPPDLSKKYDLLDIGALMDMPRYRGMMFGAGAGPFHVLGLNTELMPNIAYHGHDVVNKTRYAMIDPEGAKDDDVVCEKIRDSTGFGLMANLYGSEGLPGPAIHVRASSRTGDLNFTDAILAGIGQAFGDQLVSIGGVFVIQQGKANFHVMPDFPKRPLETRQHIEEWLRRFEFQAPITCLAVLHSGNDQGLSLRREHTHCFATDGRKVGGHYHYDLDDTREDVVYEGWFHPAEAVYRIDQPVV